MIRLIVLVDFETDDLSLAYRELVSNLDTFLYAEHLEGWETSDEWYRDGMPGTERELSAAIAACLDLEEEE